MKKAFALVLFVTMFCWLAWAGDAPKELNAAAHVLRSMTSANKIPASLLKDARCIAVIPRMTKAGLIVGGKHGNGAVSCRTTTGWSAPAFISMSGGSVGLEAGEEHQSVILLMNQQGERELKNGHWDLKAGASAAGPNGESGVSQQTGWKAPVLSYSNGKGFFAGADVGGSKIDPDTDTIHNLYGESATFQTVLDGQVKPPTSAQQFLSALRKAAH